MKTETNFLIIGAGPFGLSMSAHCRNNDIEHLVVGKKMDFWKSNMPKGMNLRSGFDWHLDPGNFYTFEKFMESYGLDMKENYPVSRDLYLLYADWFIEKLDINPMEIFIERINFDEQNKKFISTLVNGNEIISDKLLIAVGFTYFKNIPEKISGIITNKKLTHTCDIPDFDKYSGKRCLIVGGRMSALESAALLNESGAVEIFVSHRHETPEFAESDWSWVSSLLDKFIDDPGWYKELSENQKKELNFSFYKEGRLKLEPWLSSRLDDESIKLLPNTEILNADLLEDGSLEIIFNNNERIIVDHVIAATGYKVDVNKIPFLSDGNILPGLEVKNGFPVLDTNMQTNIPGLYFTSIAASQDFGSFFGFTVSCNTSAKIIGRSLKY